MKLAKATALTELAFSRTLGDTCRYVALGTELIGGVALHAAMTVLEGVHCMVTQKIGRVDTQLAPAQMTVETLIVLMAFRTEFRLHSSCVAVVEVLSVYCLGKGRDRWFESEMTKICLEVTGGQCLMTMMTRIHRTGLLMTVLAESHGGHCHLTGRRDGVTLSAFDFLGMV